MGGQPGYVPPPDQERIDQAVMDAGLRWAERHKPKLPQPELRGEIRWMD